VASGTAAAPARPPGRGRGLAAAIHDVVGDVVEVGVRAGARLDLLRLQLGGQVAVEVRACAQDGGRDRAGDTGLGIDEEELLLDAHGANRHVG